MARFGRKNCQNNKLFTKIPQNGATLTKKYVSGEVKLIFSDFRADEIDFFSFQGAEIDFF